MALKASKPVKTTPKRPLGQFLKIENFLSHFEIPTVFFFKNPQFWVFSNFKKIPLSPTFSLRIVFFDWFWLKIIFGAILGFLGQMFEIENFLSHFGIPTV
jgi:hypothetical protein